MIGFGMRLELQPVMELRLQRECSVCRQVMDEEKADREVVTAAVFGHKKYAICCCCRQEVRDHKDRNYRCRWRRWAKKLADKEGQQT